MSEEDALGTGVGNLRILLAEDDPLMAKIIQTYLGKIGCPAPVVVEDGQAAIDHLSSADEAPHAFITDLNMPGMDGIEMLRHIADLNYRGHMILITGEHADVLQTTRALAESHGLNMAAALTKPIAYDVLAASMTEIAKAVSETVVDAGEDEKSAGGLEEISVKVDPDELRQALETGALAVHYQPKAQIEPHNLSGVEALVRWNHPHHGEIGPDNFIHLAEQHDLIIDITDFVLREALTQAGRWAAAGNPITVAVNISMDCLGRLDYPDFIAALADEAGLDRSLVMLEITESRLMQELTSVLEVLTRLRMKGFGLSIDDFGTGYSSMTQLQRLPFTELKIDRVFVHGVQHDAKAQAIMSSSADLGRRLNMKIVAEGVENDEDMAYVREMGCDVVQGFIIARPMDADAFDDWLVDWRAEHQGD